LSLLIPFSLFSLSLSVLSLFYPEEEEGRSKMCGGCGEKFLISLSLFFRERERERGPDDDDDDDDEEEEEEEGVEKKMTMKRTERCSS
jgi:hypothetical protein